MAFNLGDVLKYVMTYELTGAPMFVLMNQRTYEKLDPALQSVVDQNSGSYASDMAGYYWDSTRAACIDYLKDKGVEVYAPSDELVAAFTADSIKQEVHSAYIEYLDTYKLDGQQIYDTAMGIVADYADQYADPWGAGCPSADMTAAGFAVTGWPAVKDYQG